MKEEVSEVCSKTIRKFVLAVSTRTRPDVLWGIETNLTGKVEAVFKLAANHFIARILVAAQTVGRTLPLFTNVINESKPNFALNTKSSYLFLNIN